MTTAKKHRGNSKGCSPDFSKLKTETYFSAVSMLLPKTKKRW